MKKIGYLVTLFLSVLGCFGGIGYALYNSAFVIAVGIAVLSYMAYPKVVETFNKLKN